MRAQTVSRNSHEVCLVAVWRKLVLAAESEALDDLLIALVGALFDVIEQFPALGDQGKKAAA